MTDADIQDRVQAVGVEDAIKRYALQTLARGQAVYDAHIGRLGLRGGRVLDAACDVGQWSLVLAKRFDRVDALGQEPQLHILRALCQAGATNIHPQSSSGAALPFEAGLFDAVFCHSPMLAGDYVGRVREFARVLKPGGLLYLAFGTTHWWRRRLERPDEAERGAAGEAFLNRTFRLLDKVAFEKLVPASIPLEWMRRWRGYPSAASEKASLCLPPALLNRRQLRQRLSHLYMLAKHAWHSFWRAEPVYFIEQMVDEWGTYSERDRLMDVMDRPSLEAREHVILVNTLLERWKHHSVSAYIVDKMLEEWKREMAPLMEPPLSAAWSASDAAVQKDAWELTAGILALYGAERGRESVASDILESMDAVFTQGTRSQRRRLCGDLFSRLIHRRPAYRRNEPVDAVDVREILDAVKVAGFEEVGSAWEGALLINPEIRAYHHTADARRADEIYEMVATVRPAPGIVSAWPPPQYFKDNARQAAIRYGRLAEAPMVANASVSHQFSGHVAAQLRRAVARFDSAPVLERLVGAVTQPAATREEAFLLLYRFIQDALFHHPTFLLTDDRQAVVCDPKLVLLAGIARCEQVAHVCRELFGFLGYAAKVTMLHKHVCAEVEVDGQWRAVDADLFKAGCHPAAPDGRWLSLEELRQHPQTLDALPAIGLMLSPDAAWNQTITGQTITGYVDSGLAWDRPYTSYLYFGGRPSAPPPPPRLEIHRCSAGLHVQASTLSESVRRVTLLVDEESRGWTYQDYPDERYLRPPRGRVHSNHYDPRELAAGVIVSAPETPLYVNCYARDACLCDHPDVWVWPGPEYRVAPAA